MSDADRLTPADPKDLADALAFALRYSWRKRVNDAVKWRRSWPSALWSTFERSGLVVMKKPTIGCGAAIGRGHDGRDDAAMATQRGAGWPLRTTGR